MIYILFIILIVILIISYIFSKDIFSPPCMICESYILAVFCAILNIEKWNINLSEKTVFLILYGVFLFVIPYFIFALINKARKDKSKIYNMQTDKKNNKEYIKCNKSVCLFLVIIQFIFVISYLYFFSKSMGGITLSNFAELMAKYRMEISFEESLQIPIVLKQLNKFFKGFIYIFTYIELHNKIVSKSKNEKRKISIIFIISLLLFFFQTLLSTSRSELVIYFIFALITYYTIYIHYFGVKSFNIKKIVKVVCIVLIALYGFSSLKTIFGRTSEDGIVENVSRYFGGSIELLDLYLENPAPKSDVWGKETFYNIHQVLGKAGIGETYVVHLEFRSNNGVALGNVYTAFRRMYHDFGLIGLTILQVIFSYVTFIYYKKIKEKDNLTGLSIWTVFYGILAHCLLLNSFSEYFYSSIISMNYLLIIIYMVIIRFLVTKINFKMGDKNV